MEITLRNRHKMAPKILKIAIKTIISEEKYSCKNHLMNSAQQQNSGLNSRIKYFLIRNLPITKKALNLHIKSKGRTNQLNT